MDAADRVEIMRQEDIWDAGVAQGYEGGVHCRLPVPRLGLPHPVGVASGP
jgi:hypothetical protein